MKTIYRKFIFLAVLTILAVFYFNANVKDELRRL